MPIKKYSINLKFIDVNFCVGQPMHEIYRPIKSSSELLMEMDRLDIDKALVWHIAQYFDAASEGNKMLSEFISGSDRLLGCWTILPPQTKELPEIDVFIKEMKKERIYALRIFPEFHKFLLRRVVFGKFLDEISKRKIPVLLSLEIPGINWPQVYDFLEEYPDVVCILCDVGIWGSDRYFRALLENYKNVYIETSYISLTEGALEMLVRDYGAKQLLFGSGFPARYVEAAMLQLVHADIPWGAKADIAYNNFNSILSNVKL